MASSAQSKWDKAHPKCRRGINVRYYARNADKMRGRARKYSAENRDSRNAYLRCWRAARRVEVNGKNAAWKRKNPGVVNAINAARRARERLCTCCTPGAIKELYVWAHTLGLEVDHKLALRLDGAHCLRNLEPLTPAEHAVKTSRDAALIAIMRRNK